jgi:hypothetical protein
MDRGQRGEVEAFGKLFVRRAITVALDEICNEIQDLLLTFCEGHDLSLPIVGEQKGKVNAYLVATLVGWAGWRESCSGLQLSRNSSRQRFANGHPRQNSFWGACGQAGLGRELTGLG